jgi:large subunit ribosomal protein L25
MQIEAKVRTLSGSSASRRLRHTGRVPGIIYGANQTPVSIDLDHNTLIHALKKETFHSSILELVIDGKSEKALLRDYQMHAYKPFVQHIDFLRVDANTKINVKVPLHFKGEELAPITKLAGGIVSHIVNELEISCLPNLLPAFIEVDLSGLTAGQSIHGKDLNLPEGVSIVTHGKEDPVIAQGVLPGGDKAAASDTLAA